MRAAHDGLNLYRLARFAWCIYFWFRAAAIFAANLLWSFWLVSRMMAPSRWPLWLIATSYDCPHEGGFPLSHPCISYRICARSYPWDLSCQTITLWWFLLPMNLPPNPEPLSKFVFSSNMNMNVGLCTPDIGIGLVCLEFPASAAPYLLRGTLIVSLVASVMPRTACRDCISQPFLWPFQNQAIDSNHAGTLSSFD